MRRFAVEKPPNPSGAAGERGQNLDLDGSLDDSVELSLVYRYTVDQH
jgi:hypothetical protein